MLGPSSSALINLGARFPPCMKYVSQVPPSTSLGCKLASSSQKEVQSYIYTWIGMNNTANPVTSICEVEELCGFGGMFFLLTFIAGFDHGMQDFPPTPQTNGLGTNFMWFWRPNFTAT